MRENPCRRMEVQLLNVIRSTHNIVFGGGSNMNLIAHRLRRLLISAIASENGLVLPVAISSIPSLIWL